MITEFDCKGGKITVRKETAAEISEMERLQEEMPKPEPSPEERMEAQVLYTALMTDTLLEV